MMILGALSLLGTALVVSAVSDRQVSHYERDSSAALAAAETGIALAKRAIQDMTAPLADGDNDGQPDFTLNGTLPWGSTYKLVAEAGEIRAIDISAYRSDGFTIVSEGHANGAVRRVRSEIAHDSFLKYARFVENSGTGYSCRALLTGELYVGGDLGVPNCSAGQEATFLEFVAAEGNIPNAGAGIFMRGYVTEAPHVDLQNSVDFDEIRDKSKGIDVRNDCRGVGEIGIFEDPGGGWDPIGIASTGGVLVLDKLDFVNATLQPPDTIITYNGNPVKHTLRGDNLKSDEFNGIIFFQGDARIKGSLDGVSARSMVIYAYDDVFADSCIVTGHTGYDPVTRQPNGSGEPINLGLVARDYFYLGDCPRIMQVDGAIMSVTETWRAYDQSTGAHPPLPSGPVDLDMDAIPGETPFNNDPDPGNGWDEFNLTNDHWVLNINGPIITARGGSAYPWNSSTVLSRASGPTRRYNYDLDVTEFPPPCYPVPLNLWVDVSWNEIFDAESDLEAFLP